MKSALRAIFGIAILVIACTAAAIWYRSEVSRQRERDAAERDAETQRIYSEGRERLLKEQQEHEKAAVETNR